MVMLGMLFCTAALLLCPSQSARVEAESRKGRCWDTNNGLVNDWGWGCDVFYQTENICGKYDGNGFDSNAMCCACNGGHWEEDAVADQDPCQGFTCDQWIETNPSFTCSYLSDTIGCDCSTSSCVTSCPATCDGFKCDDWIDSDHAYSCDLLQHDYGCDCSGCECKNPVLSLTDGYSLLTDAETSKSGDCMKHCIGCDHTWLPYKVFSIEGCRALCDENGNTEGIEKWCYAYSWDEGWGACRLYHEMPDGPSKDNMVCYVKEQAYSEVHSAYDSNLYMHDETIDASTPLIVDEATMQETTIPEVKAKPTGQPPVKKPPAQQKVKKVVKPQPKQELGLVNDQLWAHYMMTPSNTFKITNTYSDPAACTQSREACVTSSQFDHKDIFTLTETGRAYARHNVVFGGGDFGPFQKFVIFKPNAVNVKTTWRVADIDNEDIIHFTIQRIKGGVDCTSMGMFGCKNAWNVYRGLTRDNIIVYYAIQVGQRFQFYKYRAAFEANANNWRASVASILPTQKNGQSVLSVTVSPGEDTALLMVTAWAMHKSGDTGPAPSS